MLRDALISRCIYGLAAALKLLVSRTKLHFYLLLTHPPLDFEPKTYHFRFGAPLILKRTPRLVSTEADALRFLNGVVPHLPIPKLLDSFQIESECATYTLMTKLPGRSLDELGELSPDRLQCLTKDVLSVLHQLWCIPRKTVVTVMESASGHGLPHPGFRAVGLPDTLAGPFPSVIDCYRTMSFAVDRIRMEQPDIIQRIEEDEVVWVHTDLRMQNILVDEQGQLTGIVDWEDSGWLPRHWQLHMLRRPGPTCRGIWARFWNFEFRFDDEIEAAYSASLQKDMLNIPLCL